MGVETVFVCVCMYVWAKYNTPGMRNSYKVILFWMDSHLLKWFIEQ
jgi:hypothetical protein